MNTISFRLTVLTEHKVTLTLAQAFPTLKDAERFAESWGFKYYTIEEVAL